MDTQSDLTIRQWLRKRPATVRLFEDLAAHAAWNHLDDSLTTFCRLFSLQVVDVRHQLIGTVPVSGHEDWLEKPLYRLIDQLTLNHKDFREKDLPRIEHHLSMVKLELGLAVALAEKAHADFLSFRQEFTWHMDEEEAFLFPKILRTEACLRHPELYPEVYKGSVRMFPPEQMRMPEEAFREMLGELVAKIQALPVNPLHAAHMQSLLADLLAYGAKLKAHTYLESEILFRRAYGMEEALLKRAAKAQA